MKTTPAKPSDGDIDSLHGNELNQLVVSTVPAGIASYTTVASNGTTAVVLVAAVASKKVYPLTTCIYNSSASASHTVYLLTSGGQALLEFSLSPGGGFVGDFRGDVVTTSGDGLSFKIDSGGTGTDVRASGFYVQR